MSRPSEPLSATESQLLLVLLLVGLIRLEVDPAVPASLFAGRRVVLERLRATAIGGGDAIVPPADLGAFLRTVAAVTRVRRRVVYEAISNQLRDLTWLIGRAPLTYVKSAVQLALMESTARPSDRDREQRMSVAMCAGFFARFGGTEAEWTDRSIAWVVAITSNIEEESRASIGAAIGGMDVDAGGLLRVDETEVRFRNEAGLPPKRVRNHESGDCGIQVRLPGRDEWLEMRFPHPSLSYLARWFAAGWVRVVAGDDVWAESRPDGSERGEEER